MVVEGLRQLFHLVDRVVHRFELQLLNIYLLLMRQLQLRLRPWLRLRRINCHTVINLLRRRFAHGRKRPAVVFELELALCLVLIKHADLSVYALGKRIEARMAVNGGVHALLDVAEGHVVRLMEVALAIECCGMRNVHLRRLLSTDWQVSRCMVAFQTGIHRRRLKLGGAESNRHERSIHFMMRLVAACATCRRCTR